LKWTTENRSMHGWKALKTCRIQQDYNMLTMNIAASHTISWQQSFSYQQLHYYWK